ncbi:hypothetical protein TWF696_006279 [Orbilia brochopaga]|uniref:Uncharacterized protein n=1 Tax=Orbilia brochopaga TaxID=3140254 RepID=A0AAV9UVU6_9PEZI
MSWRGIIRESGPIFLSGVLLMGVGRLVQAQEYSTRAELDRVEREGKRTKKRVKSLERAIKALPGCPKAPWTDSPVEDTGKLNEALGAARKEPDANSKPERVSKAG